MALDSWWAERLTAAQARVVELETAVSGLLDDSILSYQLDTGQTRTLVTKQQMSQLYLALERAMNQVAVLDARVNGDHVRYVAPDF